MRRVAFTCRPRAMKSTRHLARPGTHFTRVDDQTCAYSTRLSPLVYGFSPNGCSTRPTAGRQALTVPSMATPSKHQKRTASIVGGTTGQESFLSDHHGNHGPSLKHPAIGQNPEEAAEIEALLDRYFQSSLHEDLDEGRSEIEPADLMSEPDADVLAKNPEWLELRRQFMVQLSRQFSADDLHTLAIASAREAVENATVLVRQEGVVRGPALGESLLALINRLLSASHPAEALPLIRDAIDITRVVAAQNPCPETWFQAAMSLDQMARYHVSCGDSAAAVQSMSGAADILADHSKTAGQYEYALAALLQTQAVLLRGTGNVQKALECSRRAVSTLRDVVDSGDSSQLVRLGVSLNELSNTYHAAGAAMEAFVSIEEAVKILSAVTHDAWPDDLPSQEFVLAGVSLNLWQRFQSLDRPLRTSQRQSHCLKVLEGAIQIYRSLAADNSAEHKQLLAQALDIRGQAFIQCNKPFSSVPLFEELEAIHRTLAEQDPMQNIPVAMALLRLYPIYQARGMDSAASRAVREAVDIYRALVVTVPDLRYDFAIALGFLSDQLLTSGSIPEALKPSAQAMDILADAFADDRGERRVIVIRAFLDRSAALVSMGAAHEAKPKIERLLQQVQHAADLPQAEFQQGTCLLAIAKCLHKMGKSADAQKKAEQAFDAFSVALKSGYKPAALRGIEALQFCAICFDAMGETGGAMMARRESQRLQRLLRRVAR